MPGETIDIAKVIVKQESPQDNIKRGTKSKVTKLSKAVKRGLWSKNLFLSKLNLK